MKQFKVMGLAALSSLAVLGGAASAHAQAEPILGQVSLFATNWCPRGWAQANGATIAIQSNSALFSLYGITYGGNGTTTFALPNLQNRPPDCWSRSRRTRPSRRGCGRASGRWSGWPTNCRWRPRSDWCWTS